MPSEMQVCAGVTCVGSSYHDSTYLSLGINTLSSACCFCCFHCFLNGSSSALASDRVAVLSALYVYHGTSFVSLLCTLLGHQRKSGRVRARHHHRRHPLRRARLLLHWPDRRPRPRQFGSHFGKPPGHPIHQTGTCIACCAPYSCTRSLFLLLPSSFFFLSFLAHLLMTHLCVYHIYHATFLPRAFFFASFSLLLLWLC